MDVLSTMTEDQRARGTWILGVTGTGKSSLIVSSVLEDIHAGRGVCLIDPHGDPINDVLQRLPAQREKDVILLDLFSDTAPFGLNLFSCPNPSDTLQVSLKTSLLMSAFERLWNVGRQTPLLSEVLRALTITLIETGGVMPDIPKLLIDRAYRETILKAVKNSEVLRFWTAYNSLKPTDQAELVSSTTNKINAFLAHPLLRNIVGQVKPTIDFFQIMQEKKIVLVNLSPRLAEVSDLLGTVIIGQILDAAYARAILEPHDRYFFAFYVDEFQRYATSDIARLLAESRKFNIATTIAQQYLRQLDGIVRGAVFNCGNKIIFQITAEDREEVAGIFDTTPPVDDTTEQLIPKQDVISHLLSYGHPRAEVTEFITEYLAPLELASRQHPQPSEKVDNVLVYPAVHFREGTTYRYRPTDIQKGLLALNDYLYEHMTNPQNHARLAELEWECWERLCWFLGFPHYFYGDYFKRWPKKQEKAFEDEFLGNAQRELFGLRLEGHFKWPKDKIPFSLATERLLCRLRIQKTSYVYFSNGKGLTNWNDVFFFWYNREFNFPKIGELGNQYLYDNTQALKIAALIRDKEEQAYKAFNLSLFDAGFWLSQFQVYKPSGVIVPKRGMTYADRRNMIGNELVNLPKFTAKVKAGLEEYTLKTSPLSLPCCDDVDARKLRIFYRNLQDGYLRDKKLVEEELAERYKPVVQLSRKPGL